MTLVLVLPAIICAQESRFDTGDEGWRATGDPLSAVPAWFPTGGNPGGWVRTIDASTGGTWQWVAPAQFLGNKCTAYGNFLRFDLTASEVNNNPTRPDVTLVSGNIQLVFNTPSDPGPNWTHYDVPLRENAGWRMGNLNGAAPSQAQFRAVLSNLTALRIRGEYLSLGDDEGGLDNVILESIFAFDLDANDSTTPTGSVDFQSDSLCSGESPVADTDLLLLAETRIDSLVVEILNPLDGPAESLRLPAWPPALTVAGNGSQRLVLRNAGMAVATDFQAALLLVRYRNTLQNATRAVRIVDNRVYTFCGETARARAFVPWFPAGFAGTDGSVNFCAYDAAQDLRDFLGPDISSDGRWSPPLVSGNSSFFPENDTAGNYLYIVESPAGCVSDTASLRVQVAYPPELGPDALLCRDSTLLLAVQPAGAYIAWRWNTGPNRPEITVSGAGTYVVTVTAQDGNCVFSDSVRVDLITCSECPVYVPNVFSPNDDGRNDRFQPFHHCVFRQYRLNIFDRWGNQVFASKSPEAGWDGRFRGKELPPGVFVWILEMETEFFGEGLKRRLFGNVTLVR
ncbi:MAG: gliding motility-associated C-terminal domain-containing protein [Thermoanaerobaculia bacterium]|nr:gliding motility-associated C-terminal domain-containing protein [Thermoanaerobaculia bacterium]